MTYEQIIQQVGKTIDKKVYYFIDNERIDLNENSFESAKIKFNASIIGTLMKNLELNVYEEIPSNAKVYLKVIASYGYDTAYKVYGPYNIKESKYNASEKIYELICYDEMLSAMVDYQPINIPFPCTIQDYYDELVSELGFTSNVELINGSLFMSNDIYVGIDYTYRDVLQDIAQANGILLYLEETELKEANFGVESSVINDDILKNNNIDFGEMFGPINVITLSRSADSDIIRYPDNLPEEPHEFKIIDNQLMNGNDRADYIENIYDKLNGIQYALFDTELVGWGGFTPLQKVQFQTGGNTYDSYVFNNEIELTTGFNEVIYTEIPEESTTDYKTTSTTDRLINQVNLVVDKQNQKIQSLIDTSYNLAEEVTSSGYVNVNQIQEDGVFRLDIWGDLRLFPLVGTAIVGETVLVSNKIIFESEENTYKINIPLENLVYTDEHSHDTFTYELVYDEELESYKAVAYITKRNGSKKDLVTKRIHIPKGNYKVYLESFNQAYIHVRYGVINEVTDMLTTKAEFTTSITQTEREIELLAKEKVDSSDIVASINVAVENDQGVINLKGNSVTIDSDNFKLNQDGTITSTNGNFTGTITSNSATITGGSMSINSSRGNPKLTLTGTAFNNTQSTNKVTSDGLYVNVGGTNCLDLRVGNIISGGNRGSSGEIQLKSTIDSDFVDIMNDSITTGVGSNVYAGMYSDGSISYTSLDPISLEELKKDIEIYQNKALELINNADIYTYNYKHEENTDKKHIGFIIGEKYNTPDEVISQKGNGIDLYSMAGVMWKAIKEQQKQIEQLQKEIKSLKGDD